MAKKQLIDKQTIRDLMKDGQLKDVKDIQTLLKEQFKDIMQEISSNQNFTKSKNNQLE